MTKSVRCVAPALMLAAAIAGAAPWRGAAVQGADDPVKAAEAPGKADDGSNPYLAADGLSNDELTEFLRKMQAKPETIRNRAGFSEALLEAADRLLAGKPADAQAAAALLTKFSVLHSLAVKGDAKADDQLLILADRCRAHPQEKVRAAAAFHRLEQRSAAAAELPTDQLPKLLDELQAYLATQELGAKHQRLASNTIRVVNLLPDEAIREKHFQELGKLFTKSSDKRLAKYGRDVAKIKEQESELVGTTLELEGNAVDGLPFDWSGYKGKVVLVDFWATWCGPCRAELPNVKENYEKYHAKGFEIVGVSLDSDKEALLEFIKEEDMSWTNLFDEVSTGWENPIAAKYGIKAIPAAILVGKDGKVVSTSARGPALGKQLEKLLGGN